MGETNHSPTKQQIEKTLEEDMFLGRGAESDVEALLSDIDMVSEDGSIADIFVELRREDTTNSKQIEQILCSPTIVRDERKRPTWREFLDSSKATTTQVINKLRNIQIQPTIRKEKENIAFGSECGELEPGHIRWYSQNIRTTSNDNSWSQWTDQLEQMQDRQCSIISFQETNLAWNPRLVGQATRVAKRIFDCAKVQVSNSIDPQMRASTYQPGGTCVVVTGALMGNVMSSDQDPSGLGRWSYIQLAATGTTTVCNKKYKRSLVVVSG